MRGEEGGSAVQEIRVKMFSIFLKPEVGVKGAAREGRGLDRGSRGGGRVDQKEKTGGPETEF